MANWISHYIEAENIGLRQKNETLIPLELIDDLKIPNDNTIAFDTKGETLIATLRHLSKTEFPNVLFTIGIIDEGSLFYENMYHMINGIVTEEALRCTEDPIDIELTWNPVENEP